MTCAVNERDAVLIVDVQRDFLAGGSLAVPAGDAVVPVLNRYLDLARQACRCLRAATGTRRGIARSAPRAAPGRNIASPGRRARSSPGARVAADAAIVSEGDARGRTRTRRSRAPTSRALARRRCARLLVGGLATDYCVLNTVRDAIARGFEVLLLERRHGAP